MIMNKNNLKIMYDYLIANRKRIEPNFDIAFYREGSHRIHECDSVGCVLGHGVGAFPHASLPVDSTGNINYLAFSLLILNMQSSELWDFLFSSQWSKSGLFKSFDSAMSRLLWVVEGRDYTKHDQYYVFKEIHY